MGVMELQDFLRYRMNKNSTNSFNHDKKTAAQNIKNPFLRLMKWIESAHKNNTVCKD
jgi:hypothetical protein